MKQLTLLLVVVACNNTPESIRHATRNAAPIVVSDQQRIARWHELAPTGRTSGETIERLPKVERAAMAFTLVREGRTTCPRMVEECGMTSIDIPRDDEGLDAPCLRRELVRFILVHEGRVAIPSDVLATIAHSKDEEVITAAAEALADNAVVDFLVDVEAAGTVAPQGVLHGRPREVVVDALRRHVDAAVAELSEERDRDLLIGAIADTAIDPGTRADILLGADFPSSKPLVAALTAAVAEPHCELSARAASALAKLGDPSHLPRGPEKLDVKAFLHEACRLTGADPWDESSSLVATFVPRTGLVVDAPSGAEFADTQVPSRTTYRASDDLEGSEIYLLLRTLGQAKCDAKVCVGETAHYDLGWAGGKLARVVIRRDLAKEQIVLDRAAEQQCDTGGGD